jgi:hypothetical protein
LAVHMKSPTGVGSYKQPLSPLVLPLHEPTPWAIACHGGMREIAHRVGSYKYP